MVKIRQELADSSSGWDFRQVMDLIYNKTGVRYRETSLPSITQMGLQSKVPQKRFVNTASIKTKSSKKSKTDSIQVKNGLEYHCSR